MQQHQLLLDREQLLQDSVNLATLPAVQVCHSLALAALPVLRCMNNTRTWLHDQPHNCQQAHVDKCSTLPSQLRDDSRAVYAVVARLVAEHCKDRAQGLEGRLRC